MSKKWIVVAGIAALVVVVIAAALIFMPRSTSVPNPSITLSGAKSGNATGTASSTSGGSSSTSGGKTSGSSNSGTSGSKGSGSNGSGNSGSSGSSGGNGTAGTSGGSSTVVQSSSLPVFQTVDSTKFTTQTRTTTAGSGEALGWVQTSDKFNYALQLGIVPDGTAYKVTMSPYGYGPNDEKYGSQLALHVDSATPIGNAPATNNHLTNTDVAALVDTANGGTVTTGGTYDATITFRSDGTKLRMVLSHCTAK